ncbi:TPA: hypothetical protein KO258_001742 [Clostridioides difficile]|nr:hypothetical protein [Clostridioides difficile]HBF0552538.1 hypothetical protein [Clostridioides difficile]HBF5490520.1 hypothetical protein [Clostridioides difficile]HBF5492452.1 hypothetical protein [Clostridioides difficile]HBF5496662.1 hypothetical protein [Clostridioides difficile]
MHDIRIETNRNITKVIINGHDIGDIIGCKIISSFVESGMKNELTIKLSVKNLEIIAN